MKVLAIDPGFAKSSGTGWSLWSTSALLSAGLFTSPAKRLEDRIEEIVTTIASNAGRCDEVIIEKMQVYPGQRQKGDQNDLIDLSLLGGRFTSLARATFVTPATWKGQVSKEVVQRLVIERLSTDEALILARDLKGVAPSRQHNVYDALGIGLWRLGRWPR